MQVFNLIMIIVVVLSLLWSIGVLIYGFVKAYIIKKATREDLNKKYEQESKTNQNSNE